MKEECGQLERALAAQGGSASLGALRRESNLHPQLVLELLREFPERFGSEEGREAGHGTLFIKLVELEPATKSFLVAVRSSGVTGIASTRLWQKRNITSAESSRLARVYEELIRVETRNKKHYYFWRGAEKRAVQAELASDEVFEALKALVGSGPRHLSQLEKMYPDAEKIISDHPELFRVESVNLGPTEVTTDMLVSLVSEIITSANAEVVSSREKVPVPDENGGKSQSAILLEVEISAEMKWRPPSEGMHTRRGGRPYKGPRVPASGGMVRITR